jgi:peptidoglycan hydrolase CwlO-like protein
MRTRIVFITSLIMGLSALGAVQAWSATTAHAADCSQGSAEEKVACLNDKVAALEDKIAELTKETLKWNDRISLVNEDMRIYPRCLDNAGPNAPDIAAVLASACAKTPAQSWMIRKPY